MRSRLVAACLGLTLIAPATAWGQASDQQQLERARNRVAEVAREIEAARGEVGTAESELDRAERQLAEIEAAVDAAAAAIERQERAVARAAETLAALEEQLADVEAAFAIRAADLYKSGSSLPVQVMLSASDVQDAIDRRAFLEVITSSDRATMEDVRNSHIQLRAQRARFTRERERLVTMKQEQEELLAEVEELRRTRALRAAEARSRLGELQEEQDELEADVERIETLIRERKITPVSSSLPSTEGYLWPRCDRMTSGFGRRWGRLHAGIDIAGRTGDYIAAAKAGVVIFVGQQRGYGNLTLVDHGDGVVTAYAHQSRMHVVRGQRVDRGERIGDVGNTGRSTGPHLHFETRVNGSPVDPRRFLPPSC